ncbi:MXAN_5187 C-terminal domain-containing protein [Sorangium sp. So ce117]|uniref:MXAN_5187 C-terminal domain-containing protein n=1 Tax=Sorangium sp. So ce117 TaxID=3133277 RepID=UPI003F5F348A
MWTGLPFFDLQPVPADGGPLTVNGVPEDARFCAASIEIRNLVVEMGSASLALSAELEEDKDEPTRIAPSAMMDTIVSSELEIHGLQRVQVRFSVELEEDKDDPTRIAPSAMMDTIVSSELEIHGLQRVQNDLEEALRISAEAARVDVRVRPAIIPHLIDVERQQQHRVLGNSQEMCSGFMASSLERLRSALASAAQLDLDSYTPVQLVDCASDFFERFLYSKRLARKAEEDLLSAKARQRRIEVGDSLGGEDGSKVVNRPGQQLRRADAPTTHERLDNDGILDEEQLRRIYNAYVSAKRDAGQSTAGFTFKALASKLRAHARRLQAANPTKVVDYRVVLRGGNPVLSPILR